MLMIIAWCLEIHSVRQLPRRSGVAPSLVVSTVKQRYRIGEAANPGPFSVGGASSSGAWHSAQRASCATPTTGDLAVHQIEMTEAVVLPRRPAVPAGVSSFDVADDWSFAEEGFDSEEKPYLAHRAADTVPAVSDFEQIGARPSIDHRSDSLTLRTRFSGGLLQPSLACSAVHEVGPQASEIEIGYREAPEFRERVVERTQGVEAAAAMSTLLPASADPGYRLPDNMQQYQPEIHPSLATDECDMWEKYWARAREIESAPKAGDAEPIWVRWEARQAAVSAEEEIGELLAQELDRSEEPPPRTSTQKPLHGGS